MRVLVLLHEDLVPPATIAGMTDDELARVPWKTEFDVVATLREMGHDVRVLGVVGELGAIRDAIEAFRPHVAFNMLEEFDGVALYDQHVVGYLELLKQPYTGCNPRGLLLARDKALSKKLLAYHRIRVPNFLVYPRGRTVRPPRRLSYPLFVKSVNEEASLGIAQASLVRDEARLRERVAFVHTSIGTDALVEEYVEGRELYVGMVGNQRLTTFPIWEMHWRKAPPDAPRFATVRVKWDVAYQKRWGIETAAAEGLDPALERRITRTCRRAWRILDLSGYARMDLRLRADGEVFLLEANPNPQIGYGEDFAESAEVGGIGYDRLLQRILNLGRRYRAPWKG